MSVEGLVGVECGGEGAEVWPAGVAIEGWSTVVEPTQLNPQLVQWIPYEDSAASAPPPPRAPQPASLWPADHQYPLMTISNNQQPVWTHITRDAPQQNYWAQQAFENNHNQCSPVYTNLHQPAPHPASLSHPQYNAPATNQRFSNEQFKLKPNYQTLVQHPAATAPATNQQQPLYHITINRQPPPSTKPVKKVTKRKRVRTAFTTDQILALEEVYSTQTYVNRNERQVLTDRLKISDRAIKVWFQNRRMKGKRESQALEYSDEFEGTPEQPEPIQEPSSSIDSVTSNSSSELDYVESQIKRSDEHGYVTLDDKAWGTLFNVIDPYVPNYVGLSPDTTTKEIVTEDLKTEFYEPISPAESNGSVAEDMES